MDLARDLPDAYTPVTFTDVTEAAGIDFEHFWGRRSSQLPEDMGSGAAWGDYDRDGWLDLYVPGYVQYRRLARTDARVADYRGVMGIAVGDWDGDTDLDMVVTHWIAQENALYTNQLVQDRASDRTGGIRFADEADRYGLAQRHPSGKDRSAREPVHPAHGTRSCVMKRAVFALSFACSIPSKRRSDPVSMNRNYESHYGCQP